MLTRTICLTWSYNELHQRRPPTVGHRNMSPIQPTSRQPTRNLQCNRNTCPMQPAMQPARQPATQAAMQLAMQLGTTARPLLPATGIHRASNSKLFGGSSWIW